MRDVTVQEEGGHFASRGEVWAFAACASPAVRASLHSGSQIRGKLNMLTIIAFAAGVSASSATSDLYLLRAAVAAESKDRDDVDVVVSKLGETQTVIGRFDIGLSPGFTDNEALKHVRVFADSHPEWFSPTLKRAFADWHLEQADGDVDGLRVLTLSQWSNELRWFDSEIVVSIYEEDGALHSISGELREAAVAAQRLDARPRAGSTMGYDPRTNAPTYQEQVDHTLSRIDVDTGHRFAQTTSIDHSITKQCSILNTDWGRDTNGFIVDARSMNGGTRSVPAFCSGDEIWFSSDCVWKLRAGAGYTGQGLKQLVDGSDDGLGQNYERTLACSTSTPSFASTTSNNTEQRDVFVWLSQVANVSEAFMFDVVDPGFNGSHEVKPHTDYNIMAPTGGRYDDTLHEIFFNSVGLSAPVVWHEYGHHVANMYGNLDNWCDAFVNEGDAIDEATGAMVGMITILKMSTRPDDFGYSAARSMGLGSSGVLSPHSDTFTPRVYDGTLCDQGIYVAAAPFSQAFWEVLTNRNCSTSGCLGSTYVFRSSNGLTTASENTHTSRIAKSLASALKLTPGNTTFANLLSFMNSSWQSSFGKTDAADIRAVFTHHGF